MTIETFAMVSTTAITCLAVGTAYLVRVHGLGVKCLQIRPELRARSLQRSATR